MESVNFDKGQFTFDTLKKIWKNMKYKIMSVLKFQPV